MSTSPVRDVRPLGPPPWETADPFLFCVHHLDAYPAGNERLGPAAPLIGRPLGMDFAGIDGWRMYHGEVVPGFPQHPHRGFETVTVVRRGFIDHADSLGAAARYGAGDVQWLTAGQGICHAEMFPLLDQSGPNPVELFQIWLNLPAADKLAPPHFSMLWRERVPVHRAIDEAGRAAELTLVAGQLAGLDERPPPPPPRSWAARPDTDVCIAVLALDPGASFTLAPSALPAASRTLYVFRGEAPRVDGHRLATPAAVWLRPDAPARLEAGEARCEALLLQGRPIREPVAQYGPFVMNTRAEIARAFLDYQRTRFGGWPWPVDDPVHGPEPRRFARHADGRLEAPP